MGKIVDWSRKGFIDRNTILANIKKFISTGKFYKNNKIYKDVDTGNYFYRDPTGSKPELMHNHLEVFDKRYNHIGTADPISGLIDYTKAVPGRSISDIMK